jgi:hypothetical protein
MLSALLLIDILIIMVLALLSSRYGKNVFYEATLKKIQKLFKNTILIVIRIGDQDKRIMMSKPCANCIRYIKLLNIKKIYYSDKDGNLVREGANIKSDHHSRLSISISKKMV